MISFVFFTPCFSVLFYMIRQYYINGIDAIEKVDIATDYVTNVAHQRVSHGVIYNLLIYF